MLTRAQRKFVRHQLALSGQPPADSYRVKLLSDIRRAIEETANDIRELRRCEHLDGQINLAQLSDALGDVVRAVPKNEWSDAPMPNLNWDAEKLDKSS